MTATNEELIKDFEILQLKCICYEEEMKSRGLKWIPMREKMGLT